MKIVVLGGGSSGWLAAAGLVKTFPNYQICVIESKSIPTIGVGESTTTLVRNYITDFLGIEENFFLKEVDGIYKMSVKFNNFSKSGLSYHYPFSIPVTKQDLKFSYWDILKHFYPHLKNEDLIKLTFPASHLFMSNKIDRNENGNFDTFNFNNHLGYHFDANKLGIFLKDKYCIPRNVKYIQATVTEVLMAEEKVESLVLDDGSKISADLFVDCTGYRSVLLGQKMRPRFIDTSDKLFNNRAWATPVKYKNVHQQMQPYTTATAIENGWCWYTPIASRIGNGYAYSDKFVEPDEALNQFKKYILENKNYSLTEQEVDSLPFFEIFMKTGYYEKSMVKNVVAIGLSSGFLEPLEGTGLHFIIEETTALFKIIQNGVPNQFLIDSFNTKIKKMYETWTNGLMLIYLLSGRTDTPYWKEISNLSFDKDEGQSAYLKRAMSWTGHNNTYDLFCAVSRGSGLLEAFDEFDSQMLQNADNFSSYYIPEIRKMGMKNFAQSALRFHMNNKNKWELAAMKALHIYDFLKINNAIREG